MIHRSASVPSVRRPAPQSLTRTVTEQAIAVPAHPQPPVVFDVGSLPPELQQLISAAIGNPHDTCTLAQLQEALKAFKAASEVNTSFHRGALPRLHATFLRLFGAGRIRGASLDSLPQNLSRILENIVARSGLSGLQCLSDLVNGSLREDPRLATKAFNHWIHLALTTLATPALPYKALPTLIAARLGQMLRRPGVPPRHALNLLKQLLRIAKSGSLPHDLAMPVLIEVVLAVQTQEVSRRGSFRAPPELGQGVQWVELGSADVLDAMASLGSLTADLEWSLLAVVRVLATRWTSGGTPLTKATVLTALDYLADGPYPLLGCLAEALDIIQGLDLGHDPQLEELLARCAAKRASVRLLAVNTGPASGSLSVTPLAGAQVLENGQPVTLERLRQLGVIRYLDPSPQ